MIREIELQYNKEEIESYIHRFSGTSVLVIGDIILDEYIWGDVTRISPEAPVPVVEVREETKRLGGAANVINNIRSLGGKPVLCGVIGNDPNGKEILNMLSGMQLPVDGIIIDPARPTSIKTRIVAHNQQVVRFDRENRVPIGANEVKKLVDFIEKKIDKLDGIIVADYGKGVISSKLVRGLKELADDSDIIVAVDPNTENFEFYQGMDIITPNHHEAGTFCRFKIEDEGALIRAGEKILGDLDCHSVLITQGRDGMTLFEKGETPCHIATEARNVFDVSGAGDTVIGTLCLGLASGMDLRASAIISNFAAGIVVGEIGTSVVTAKELTDVIKSRLRPAAAPYGNANPQDSGGG